LCAQSAVLATPLGEHSPTMVVVRSIFALGWALGAGAATTGGSTATSTDGSTCGGLKAAYKEAACCGETATKVTGFQATPVPTMKLFNTNFCDAKKPIAGFENHACMVNGVVEAVEQAGANVTAGYQGLLNAGGRVPITTSYLEAGLCPVNVHWHLGTEHYSAGQYDEFGTGPKNSSEADADGQGDSRRLRSRSLAANARLGYRCKHYMKHPKFEDTYKWKHCMGMHVGETYEVHWPHSAAGACGTPYQWQTPFYDGVFCVDGIITLAPLNTFQKIGVQAQVFVIVNDESYYYPDLMRGMITDGAFGQDMAMYTGSTTGTSRDNTICSKYAPITWQVDRKCHLISASSFDKMCADMKSQSDDMSSDLHPHGSRMLVADNLAANNQQR